MSPLAKKVVDLAIARVKPAEIAQRLQIAPGQVHGFIQYARRTGVEIPRFSTAPGRENSDEKPTPRGGTPDKGTASRSEHLAMPVRVMGLLRKQAERRGLTPSELAQRIIEREVLKTWAETEAEDV